VVLDFYPVAPWLVVMLFGYGLAPWFLMAPAARDRRFVALGAAMLALFLLLRYFNLYGDPHPWTVQASIGRSVMSFLRVEKYPPSLFYVCATLVCVRAGAAVLTLAGPTARVLLVFGSVPLCLRAAPVRGARVRHPRAPGRRASIAGEFDQLRVMLHPQLLEGTGVSPWPPPDRGARAPLPGVPLVLAPAAAAPRLALAQLPLGRRPAADTPPRRAPQEERVGVSRLAIPARGRADAVPASTPPAAGSASGAVHACSRAVILPGKGRPGAATPWSGAPPGRQSRA
jgi:hypothetical protein